MNLLNNVVKFWADICHGILSLWPNLYIEPYLLKMSFALSNYIWPLDPKNGSVYGNFQNLAESCYFYTTFATLVLLAESFLVIVIAKKIVRGFKVDRVIEPKSISPFKNQSPTNPQQNP
jgi:hypothetical protein